jgi:hypothetical protein
MAGESSTIKTRYANLVLLSSASRREFAMAARFLQNQPAGCNFETHGTAGDSPHCFALQQHAMFPEQAPGRQIVPLADFK